MVGAVRAATKPYTLALAFAVLASAPADAAVYSFPATGAKRDALVFRIKGVDPALVRSARVDVYSHRWRISRHRARRAARRGVLRTGLPKMVRIRTVRTSLRGRTLRNTGTRRVSARDVRSAARLLLRTRLEPIARPNATWTRPPCPVSGNPRFVAPWGSNANPGTFAFPWRTLRKAAASADPGDTVYVRSGTYSDRGRVTSLERSGTPSAPISFVAYPGDPTPTVRGLMSIEGDHLRVCGFLFDGPTGPVSDWSESGEEDQVVISGDHVELTASEVRNNRFHAGILVSEARHTSIVGNYIHANGRFGNPAMANLDHGIYWASGSGVIAGNLIARNYAYGVHLYPRPSNVLVTRNRITGHGRAGVIVAGQASGIRVVENEIWGNRQGVQSWDLTGSGNLVQGNMVWGNRQGDFVAVDGLTMIGNRVK